MEQNLQSGMLLLFQLASSSVLSMYMWENGSSQLHGRGGTFSHTGTIFQMETEKHHPPCMREITLICKIGTKAHVQKIPQKVEGCDQSNLTKVFQKTLHDFSYQQSSTNQSKPYKLSIMKFGNNVRVDPITMYVYQSMVIDTLLDIQIASKLIP